MIVCDGFVGNVILKLTEGVAWNILKLIRNKMMKNIKNKLAALMMRSDLNAMKKEFDYEEYGGAPILGINGPVIKIHGSSGANAVKTPYEGDTVQQGKRCGDHQTVYVGSGRDHRKR